MSFVFDVNCLQLEDIVSLSFDKVICNCYKLC